MEILSPEEAKLALACDPGSFIHEEDERLTQLLRHFLVRSGVIESPDELTYRNDAMESFRDMVSVWVTGIRKTVHGAQSFDAKALECGSYKLGVHMREADIDLTIVCTNHIDRSMIFQSFLETLRNDSTISVDRSLDRIHTPVIKITWKDIQFDIAFSRLTTTYIPDEMALQCSNILKGMEWPCIRSLNSWKDACEIASLIPNLETFRLAIIAIKLWSHKRGIHSNGLGFLGGITYTLLVLKAAQLYPTAKAASLIQHFFHTFTYWKWPSPVIVKAEPAERLNSSLPIWDASRSEMDRSEFMPILTPSYPRRNSSPHVDMFNLTTITEEMSRALEISGRIRIGELYWEDLFDPIDYFQIYQHFIVIIVETDSDWSSYIRARLRYLTETLSYNLSITHLRIIPRSFTWISRENSSDDPVNFTKNYRAHLIGIVYDGYRDDVINAISSSKTEFIYRVRDEGSERFPLDLHIDIIFNEKEDVISSVDPIELTPDYPFNKIADIPDPDSYDESQSDWLSSASYMMDLKLNNNRPKVSFLESIKTIPLLPLGVKTRNWYIDPVPMMKSCYCQDKPDYRHSCSSRIF